MSNPRAVLFATLVCALTSACASGGSTAGAAGVASARRMCAPVTDSVFLVRGVAFRDCDVDEQARIVTLPKISFTPGSLSQECFSAVLDFVVDERGWPLTETVHVERSATSAFTQAVLAALPTVRYTPAKKGGMPVKQLVRYEPKVAFRVSSSAGGSSTPRRAPNC